MKTFRFICIMSAAFSFFIAVVCLMAAIAHAADITLQWNPVAEADGYKLYSGIESGHYSSPTDVGNVSTHTVNSLPPNTYYFVVTAYNVWGESGYSNEVWTEIIPAGQQIPPADPGMGPVTTTYQMPDGSTVVIVKP